MKEYPKILGSEKIPLNEECIAFYKLDGSNLRFEYSKNKGWYKFGTRRRLFDHTDPDFGSAIDLFLSKYADQVEKIVLDNFKKPDGFIVYAEFFGPHSFAGIHDPAFLDFPNDPKDVVIFDVNVHKKGFISPRKFVDLFGHLHIPEIVYEGPLSEQFVKDIREGKYPVIEGVVAKGGEGHNLWMRKVKTFAYLKRLQEVFGVGWSQYWE